jgi:putative alpha-1,2-mannosidase
MLTGSDLRKAVLKTDGGKHSLVISATGFQGSPRYIRSVKLNGNKWRSAWLPLSELNADSDNEIIVDYVSDPGNWATRESDDPPTLR